MKEMSNRDRIKEYLLGLLECGKFKTGDKLPGARQLASEVGVSLPNMQFGIENLTQYGIFETRLRSGTYVQEGWEDRIVPGSFIMHNALSDDEEFTRLMNTEIPQIHMSRKFSRSVFEVKISHELLSHHNEFINMDSLFKECFPDQSEFFSAPLTPFILDGKLCGVPIFFSPRVMVLNRRIFESCGCPLPQDNWSWNEFLGCIDILKSKLPGNHIFCWSAYISQWINVVARAGGMLFVPNASDPVRIDSPDTVRGLQIYTELRERLEADGSRALSPKEYRDEFTAGNTATQIVSRQEIYGILRSNPDLQKDLVVVSLPLPDGGRDVTAQATELLCIRKECADYQMARQVLKLLLSEKIQDFFGQRAFGIPFRRSSAQKSLNLEDVFDVKFLTGIPRMVTEYNIFSPELYSMVSNGIAELCHQPVESIPAHAAGLAEAVRLFLHIKKASSEATDRKTKKDNLKKRSRYVVERPGKALVDPGAI